MTELAAKGWLDRDFIAKSTTGFDEMLAANKVSIDEAARVTGLKPDDIRKAAAWIAEPKQGGARRRTMFAYEKGLIWGNDNYRTNGALVNIALATGTSVGRARVRSHRRSSGGLRQARIPWRKAGALCRSAADQRQRRRPPHLGVR